MNENKKFSISNMMLAFITVLVVIGLVALAGFFPASPPGNITYYNGAGRGHPSSYLR